MSSIDSQTAETLIDGNKRRIQAMDTKTVRRLSSGQVVTSLANVVKELIENSIDAKSTVLTIRLKELGKESIEVTDNGFGIDDEDFDSLGKRHFTSKLSEFEDLPQISSFGFRGEALNSLCNLADISIQTRYLSRPIGTELKFNSDAIIVSREPMARKVGTTVLVQNLFHNIPVRRKEFYTNIRREFDKMLRLVYGYCVGRVGLRITLTNQMASKSTQTILSSSGLSIRSNIIEVFDKKQSDSLVEFRQALESQGLRSCSQGIQITGFISNCDPGCGRSATDRQFFYVNRRPCEMKKISKFINEIYHSFNRNQYPFVLLDIGIDKSSVDFNLSPDKRQLMIANEEQVFEIIKESLYKMYNKEKTCLLDSMSNYTIKEPVFQQKRYSESVDEEVSCIMESPLKRSRCRSPCDSPFKATTSRDSNSNTPPIPSDTVLCERREIPKNFTTALNVMNENVVKRPQFETQITISSESVRSQANGVNDWQQKDEFKANTDIPVIVRDVPMGSTEKRVFSAKTDKIIVRTDRTDSTECVQKKNKSLTEFVITYESDEENEQKIKNSETIETKTERNGRVVELDIDMIRELYQKSVAPKVWTSEHKFSAKISESQNERAENELIHELKKDSFEAMQTIGQFNRGFIITKLMNHLFIVDQHASDERFNYERLLANTPIQTQNLVQPLALELSAANEMLVIDNINAFKRLGFGIVVNETAPTGHKIYLSGLPISKEWTAGKEDFDEVIGTIIETPIQLLNDYKLNGFKKVIASRACRSSVMIGQEVSESEMKTIISHMSGLKNPWHCAHNRPTIRHLLDMNSIYSIVGNQYNSD